MFHKMLLKNSCIDNFNIRFHISGLPQNVPELDIPVHPISKSGFVTP